MENLDNDKDDEKEPKQKKICDDRTLSKLTIKQVLSAKPADDYWNAVIVDGQNVVEINMMVQIKDVTENSEMGRMWLVNDYSGEMHIRRYNSDEEPFDYSKIRYVTN